MGRPLGQAFILQCTNRLRYDEAATSIPACPPRPPAVAGFPAAAAGHEPERSSPARFPTPRVTRHHCVLRTTRMESKPGLPPKQGLYDPRHEHDACGVG